MVEQVKLEILEADGNRFVIMILPPGSVINDEVAAEAAKSLCKEHNADGFAISILGEGEHNV